MSLLFLLLAVDNILSHKSFSENTVLSKLSWKQYGSRVQKSQVSCQKGKHLKNEHIIFLSQSIHSLTNITDQIVFLIH